MVYVIGPLSNAGEARSDLGTAFRGVECIRIGLGERLTLLIWWSSRKVMDGLVAGGVGSWEFCSQCWSGGVLVGRISVAVGGNGLLNPVDGADALEATTLPIMMMAVLVMVIYGNQVPERLAPWWARPLIHQRRSRSSRPPGRAAFAHDLADGFSVRFRSDHLMGLRPDSIKEINSPHLGQEITGLRPCSSPEKGTRKGDYYITRIRGFQAVVSS